jgi:hypothetical protein
MTLLLEHGYRVTGFQNAGDDQPAAYRLERLSDTAST